MNNYLVFAFDDDCAGSGGYNDIRSCFVADSDELALVEARRIKDKYYNYKTYECVKVCDGECTLLDSD